MSLGEDRVRLLFNPSGSRLLDEIKLKSADLIDLCEMLKRSGGEPTPELHRCVALAQTAYEQACMWAVKAATFEK